MSNLINITSYPAYYFGDINHIVFSDKRCILALDTSTHTGITHINGGKVVGFTHINFKKSLTELTLMDLHNIGKEFEEWLATLNEAPVIVFFEKVFGGGNFDTVRSLLGIHDIYANIVLKKGAVVQDEDNTEWKSKLNKIVSKGRPKPLRLKGRDKAFVREALTLLGGFSISKYKDKSNEQDIFDSIGILCANIPFNLVHNLDGFTLEDDNGDGNYVPEDQSIIKFKLGKENWYEFEFLPDEFAADAYIDSINKLDCYIYESTLTNRSSLWGHVKKAYQLNGRLDIIHKVCIGDPINLGTGLLHYGLNKYNIKDIPCLYCVVHRKSKKMFNI